VISIETRTSGTTLLTDRSVVSACLLGFFGSELFGSRRHGSGLIAARLSDDASVALSVVPTGLPVRERNGRPTKALEAGVAEAKAYATAAAGATTQKQAKHDHKMWAFRGLEPWSDPV